MAKYKIGEVSRILGIPKDTLHYYERRGIVTPHKDKETGYRYYDAWDLNFLLDSKWYRSFDFSLIDVVEMINEDDHNSFLERCAKHEEELLQKIQDYQQKLKALSAYRQKAAQIKNELGVLELTMSPALIFQRHRYEYEFILTSENLASAQKWISLLPYAKHTFTLSGSKNLEESGYFWGFSLAPDDAVHHGIENAPPAEYIPSQQSIRTVFSAGGRDTFLKSIKSQVFEKILTSGYKITGNPYGYLLVRLHVDGVFTRYFEIWVPVEGEK